MQEILKQIIVHLTAKFPMYYHIIQNQMCLTFRSTSKQTSWWIVILDQWFSTFVTTRATLDEDTWSCFWRRKWNSLSHYPS